MSVFQKKLSHGSYDGSSQVDKALSLITQTVNTQQLSTSQVAKAALSMESISENASHALNAAYDELSVAVESIAAEMGISKIMTRTEKLLFIS